MEEPKKWTLEGFTYSHWTKEFEGEEIPYYINNIITRMKERKDEESTVEYYSTKDEETGIEKHRILFESGTGNTLWLDHKKRKASFYLTS